MSRHLRHLRHLALVTSKREATLKPRAEGIACWDTTLAEVKTAFLFFSAWTRPKTY